jgi:clathrin heavy chain
MDYIKRLDQYDGPAIAVIAIEHELYEEAFEIYRRQNYSAEALKVLLQNIGDVNRASEFADKVGKPEVWSLLGHAYLDNNMVE